MTGVIGALRVVHSGPLLLVQDGGRPGYRALGVPTSGFADRTAARRANRLVGNGEEEALLEALLGPVTVAAEGASALVAVTGVVAAVHIIDADGSRWERSAEAPVVVPAGGLLEVGTASAGLRAYLAVRGGIGVPPVLGSRSRDTLSALGPDPLGDGDVIPIGAGAGVWTVVDHIAVAPPAGPGEVITAPVTMGPRDGLLSPEGRHALLEQEWTVSPRSDRVGVRLEGIQPIELTGGLAASEGTLSGGVEVPGDGSPFVLLRDHPVTVGYPVVAVVEEAALNRIAQARPGTRLRFRTG